MVWKNIILFLVVGCVYSQDADCDFTGNLTAGQSYYAYSKNYSSNYPPGITCRWIATCPSGYNCRAECNDIALPQSNQCSLDSLLISKSGDPELTAADTYCGTTTTTVISDKQQLSIGLKTSKSSPGGRFLCILTAQKATSTDGCNCGYRKTNRIVGGDATEVNEYPYMAGIVDVLLSQIKCGAVIISDQYVLTAGHCLEKKKINEMAVVVGEHDVDSTSQARQVLRVSEYKINPRYTPTNYDYDAGLVMTATRILFSARVGPVCLPFKFQTNSFTGSKVTVLGWGTQFPGGPTSNVLLKVDLDVMGQSACQLKVSNLTARQMCTYTPGKDACQDDSGGPVLYTDPATGRQYSVGIISHGRFCASSEPGINSRVTTLLDWIVAMTPGANYCKI